MPEPPTPLAAEYFARLLALGGGAQPRRAWTLVAGRRKVLIRRVEPVGSYAVRLYFSDGHHTGIYTWETLHDLALNADDYWQRYLQALAAEGKTRDEK